MPQASIDFGTGVSNAWSNVAATVVNAVLYAVLAARQHTGEDHRVPGTVTRPRAEPPGDASY